MDAIQTAESSFQQNIETWLLVSDGLMRELLWVGLAEVVDNTAESDVRYVWSDVSEKCLATVASVDCAKQIFDMCLKIRYIASSRWPLDFLVSRCFLVPESVCVSMAIFLLWYW